MGQYGPPPSVSHHWGRDIVIRNGENGIDILLRGKKKAVRMIPSSPYNQAYNQPTNI